jgi:predicted SprT family Zn-dependent metalloprotease
VIAEISSDAFDSFFAWAPWVVGAIIYLAFYIAKRHEKSSSATGTAQSTYACAVCGRRGTIDQMIAQDHGGAIGYRCAHCSASAQAPAH